METPKTKPTSRWARGERHEPNPSVNRAERGRILNKRIRNIQTRLAGGSRRPLGVNLRERLGRKLKEYQGQFRHLPN